MLTFFHAARFASNHSPLRERREVFFAGATGSTSNGSEPEKEKLADVQILANELEERMSEFSQLMRDSSMLFAFDGDKVEDLWKNFDDIQKSTTEDLLLIRDKNRNEEEKMQTLLRAEKNIATLEGIFAATSDESVLRKKLRDTGISLAARLEPQRTPEGIRKIRNLKHRRDKALKILEEGCAPGADPQARAKAIADARAILASLESVDTNLERDRKKNVTAIIADTRSRLKELLPQIQALPEIKDPLLQKEFFDVESTIQGTHTVIENLLTKKTDGSRESLKNVEHAQRKVEKLQNFLDHILRGRNEPSPLTMDRYANKVRGYYDRKEKRIAVASDLSKKERDEVIAHERRHLYLHALEGLDQLALARLYNQIKFSAKGQEFLRAMRYLVRDKESTQKQGQSGHYAYKLYQGKVAEADNLPAAFEELLIRAADSRAGIRTLDPEEQAALDILDSERPNFDHSNANSIQDIGKRYAGEASPQEESPAVKEVNKEIKTIEEEIAAENAKAASAPTTRQRERAQKRTDEIDKLLRERNGIARLATPSDQQRARIAEIDETLAFARQNTPEEYQAGERLSQLNEIQKIDRDLDEKYKTEDEAHQKKIQELQTKLEAARKKREKIIEDEKKAKEDNEKGTKEKEIVKPKTSLSALQSKIHSKTKELREMAERLSQMEGVIDEIPDGKEQERVKLMWNAHKKVLTDSAINFRSYEEFVALANKWESGKLPPAELNNYLESLLHTKLNVSAVVDPVLWNDGNISTRMVLAEKFPLRDFVEGIEKQVELAEKALPRISDNCEDLLKFHKSLQAESGGGWAAIGLEFYSINQVVESVKNVVDSFSKAWGNWHQLKVGKLSNQMGATIANASVAGFKIPFSDQAKMTLELELDHKDDEIRESFKKHLEHDLASFDHMTNHHHGVLELNKNDGNRFRGAIEYMASKAWLYDLDIENRTIFGIKFEVGKTLPGHWSEGRVEEYLRDLEQQQSKGESSEIDRGKSRVNNYPDIPPMIDTLNDELERNNYWATFGILERIAEKGKMPESPVWASVSILNAIRKKEAAQKYFPRKLLDKFGNIGLPSGMIHKLFKIDRDGITAYQKSLGKMNFAEAGTFAAAFTSVENEITTRQARANLPQLSETQLMHLISRVLAGQTVEQGRPPQTGWALSIFDNQPAGFYAYRTWCFEHDNKIEAKDLDDDYYNPENPMTEIVLGSPGYFFQILETASEGAFKAGEKAKKFMEKLLVHDNALLEQVKNGKIPRSVLDNYRSETKKKLDTLYASWTQQTIQLPGYKAPTIAGNPLMLLSLVRRHMLSAPTDKKTKLRTDLGEQVAEQKKNPEPFYIEP